MPSEDTPIYLNDSDFWIRNCVRTSVRASNSFKVAKKSWDSAIFTEEELSHLLSQLPFSRQTSPTNISNGTSSKHTSNQSSNSPPSKFTQFIPIRTSRSVERQVLRQELKHMEEAEIDYGIYIEQQKQTNITTVQQRNQLMKINEGLAKYISRNTN